MNVLRVMLAKRMLRGDMKRPALARCHAFNRVFKPRWQIAVAILKRGWGLLFGGIHHRAIFQLQREMQGNFHTVVN